MGRVGGGSKWRKARGRGTRTCVLQAIVHKQNEIKDEGACAIAASLRHCPSLQHLNLKQNGIRCKEASGLVKNLPHPSLQHLLLQNNQFEDEGACAIAVCLPQFPSLQHLDLRNNGICSKGAAALADYLPHCGSLQTLKTGNNHFRFSDEEALTKAAFKCPSFWCFMMDEDRGVSRSED